MKRWNLQHLFVFYLEITMNGSLLRVIVTFLSHKFPINCKTLPSNLPVADCSIFTLSVVGRRRHVLLPLILPP